VKKIAFDADVLIYSADPNHPLGQRVGNLLVDPAYDGKRFGSTLLLPETLIKPTRLANQAERDTLLKNLTYLELIAPDKVIAMLAVGLGAHYALKTPDAVHLATAVHVGADALVTNNRKDFDGKSIAEITVVYPDALFSL
jgi:uncharacterized protein